MTRATDRGVTSNKETMVDLAKLSEPFPLDDIEWRVARAGIGPKGIYCMVLAYITARAIQKRLDEVCKPENWRLETPLILEINAKSAFACGLSVRIGEEWVTKWDVSDPTNIEPAKGGWSGAMKRAGAQWGIGRYLYHLSETFAEVAEKPPGGTRGWNYAKIKTNDGPREYHWKRPGLPGWAVPKEPEYEITLDDLNGLKRAWKDKFAPESKNPADLRDGFSRFVESVVGEFPVSDYTCWTRDALERCQKRIEETTDPNGVSADVPFEE